MATGPGPGFDGLLPIVLQSLFAIIRDRDAEVAASQRAADAWERRAVLGAATLANELGLRVREAEVRERRLRRQLAELIHADRNADELRRKLAQILADVT